MICPICYRNIGVTSKGIIKRHGFRRKRWDINGDRTDSVPCPGSGRIGRKNEQEELLLEELRID